MKNKKLKRIVTIVVLAGIIGGSFAAYKYFMPHRDVQKTKAFAELNSEILVKEFLNDMQTANSKYLSSDGNSKVLIITGSIFSIDQDQNGQTVYILKGESQNAGISCTFLKDSSVKSKNHKIGDLIKVKGVIRSGAGYDEDLEMYEDVIMEDCDIVK